jgi:DNA helicase-2/ATP-dependent DNA helicase PcrA
MPSKTAKIKTENAHASKAAGSSANLLENLNSAQKKAVTFGNGPLLIIAGAGTGKTTVITRRIANLISQEGIKPDEILALTFTDKAATEMEERVDLLLPYGYYNLWISTFHALCERILKQHALDIGISNDFKVLDTIQQKILIRKNLDKFDLDYYRPLGNPTKFISEMAKHFSKLKDEEISTEDYLKFGKKQQLDSDNVEFEGEDEIKRLNEIANAYHVYQKLLLDENSLDFGDLINFTLKLFRSRKKILEFYQKKFKFILVDEFQDTNYAQYELIRLLAEPKNNLNVVGDDDQSIYKFRGASVSNILKFKKDFPTAAEITLNENYRSSQSILDLSYNFIQANNPDRLEAKLKISKKLKANIKETGEIAVISAQSGTDEVGMVTKKIIELKKQKSLTWNDFAILVRANDQADPFISKFAAIGMPYTYFANKGLYKKAIILDLVYYMKVLLNHHDSSSLYRVLNMEIFRIDHTDLSSIMHFAHKKTLSLFEAMQLAATIPNFKAQSIKKIQSLLSSIEKHSLLALQKNAVEVFINMVKDLQIARLIDKDTLENLENREILEQFYRKIEQFETDNADKSVKNFLEILNFEQEAGEEGKLNFDPNQGPESIKVMTIHSAKGLEFKNVFIVGMVHLRFPSIARKDAIEIPGELIKEILPEGDAHLEEERRLFYVAATRAKNGLYFSYAQDYGGAKVRKPSQFLMDIGLLKSPEKSAEIIRKEKSIERNYDPSLFLPDTFSFTQISDFLRCPMRYKYRHLLHLPLPGNANLSFGQTIHVTLEKFLNLYKTNLEMTQLNLFDKKSDSKLPTFEELQNIYEKSWVDEWYTSKAQKEEFKNSRGKEILKSFYAYFSKQPVVPKYIEKSFRMNIGNYFFTGKIDRADLNGSQGLLHIIDYKTGKTKLEKKEDRQQLLIYQWAAQEYLKEKVASLKYWYLLDNTFSEDFLGSEQDLSELKASLLETIEKIRAAAASNSFKELDKKISHDCEFDELD